MHQVASHTAVHPVAVPPQFPRFLHPVVRMKVLAGSPGTMGGLALRLAQTGFSLISLCIMISITGFSSISAFWFLVAAMVFQFIWSFSIGVLDTALLTKRSLWNPRIVSLVVVGDWACVIQFSYWTATVSDFFFLNEFLKSGIGHFNDDICWSLRSCGNRCADS